MPAKRRGLVIRDGVFSGGYDTRLDQLGSPFRVGQYPRSGLLVPATSRLLLKDTRAVKILRGVGARFENDSVGTVLSGPLKKWKGWRQNLARVPLAPS